MRESMGSCKAGLRAYGSSSVVPQQSLGHRLLHNGFPLCLGLPSFHASHCIATDPSIPSAPHAPVVYGPFFPPY